MRSPYYIAKAGWCGYGGHERPHNRTSAACGARAALHAGKAAPPLSEGRDIVMRNRDAGSVQTTGRAELAAVVRMSMDAGAADEAACATCVSSSRAELAHEHLLLV
ncbi:hypothetical protein B0H17DRAFT_1146947 [Mycena rosella]|uniref:Uncharacterized protein n=1 Tax=Mycena rosella TaxID=1033263 RepID=A0AAD7CMW6_MYCRO|nr:hypothetical protein B0H17DRAFT_1146947 [Mycena rosella]